MFKGGYRGKGIVFYIYDDFIWMGVRVGVIVLGYVLCYDLICYRVLVERVLNRELF